MLTRVQLPLFAAQPVFQSSRQAQVPMAHTTGDVFFSSQAPKFGHATVETPVTRGNGKLDSLQAVAVEGKPGVFDVMDTKKKKAVGRITFTDPATTATIQPYASKDGQYMWLTAKPASGGEYRILIGAGGKVAVQGIEAELFPDGETDIPALLPEAEALAAAKLNERTVHAQNYVRTMFIPASSLGTRFQPIGEALDDEGKPNVYLHGQTSILRELVEHYKHFGIENFIIGVPTHRAKEFAKNLEGTGVNIQYISEDSPTGTAGIIGRILTGEYPNIKFDPSQPLLVGAGDAVLKAGFDVGQLVDEHVANNADATLVAAKVPDEVMHKFGMILSEKPNESSKITKFFEKPDTPEKKAALGVHRLASSMIYVLAPKTIQLLKEKYEQLKSGKLEKYDHGFDFAGHVFEKEVDNLNLFVHAISYDKWVDIGHLNTMNKAHRRIANGEIMGEATTKAAREQIGDNGEIYYGGKDTKAAFKGDFADANVQGNVVVIKKAA